MNYGELIKRNYAALRRIVMSKEVKKHREYVSFLGDVTFELQGMPDQFFVVTKPIAVSELDDILVSCSWQRFVLQVMGGLDHERILGIYSDKDVASRRANEALAARPKS